MRLYNSCAIQLLVCLIERMETMTTQVNRTLHDCGNYFSAGSAKQDQTLAQIWHPEWLRGRDG